MTALRAVSKEEVSGSRKTPKPKAPVSTPSVVGQVRIAFQRKNMTATLTGCALGTIVPASAYLIVHGALAGAVATSAYMSAVVYAALTIGALIFSAPTVYQWCASAFRSRAKAVGWVLLVEGTMVAPLPDSLHPLALVCLGFLIAINAIATGTNLSKP